MTAYTKISLEQLDYIRLELRAKLKRLEAETGDSYSIRTFYCGPRRYRDRSTLKSKATAAKIGIYKETYIPYRYCDDGYTINKLVRYI